MKIISLVPSITEALFDFGLDHKEVVGRTKFCIHPAEKVPNVPIVGGTKNLHPEKIFALSPDLIIANREENEKLQIEELAKEFEVWVTEIATLEDNRKFLQELGKKLNKPDKAAKFISEIDNALPETELSIKAAYLIWQNPYMTVGNDTFIHDVMQKTGLINIFGNKKRYPEITVEALEEAGIILLSSEPFPFKAQHVQEMQQIFPDKKVVIVDGEAFSWYGTHLARRKAYFEKLQKEIFG